MTTVTTSYRLRAAWQTAVSGWHLTQNLVGQLIRYVNCFGVLRGPLLCLWAMAARFGGGTRLVTATVRGPTGKVRLRLRLRSSDVGVFNGIFEWEEYGWEFGGTPRVIVDAGGYTGLSAVYFALRFPDARIIAIEPSAANFSLLLENTAKFANIEAVNAALWTHSGSLTLVDPGHGEWGFRVADSPSQRDLTDAAPGSANDIVATTIPEVLKQFGLDRIDLLKVDIEGGEKEVFADSAAWIDQVDGICMELHDRFKPGCSRAFFDAVKDFPIESWRGENVLVLRSTSRLAPVKTAPASG